MSEKDINRWHDTITPHDKAPQPWSIGSGGSWDMLEVQPIPDDMLAELAQRYHYAGTPWNCRSMPLSASDREYMYLLYSCMQGLVARMRQAERKAAEGPQWLPIETAPQDGTHILVYFPRHPIEEDLSIDESVDLGGVVAVTFKSGGGWVEPDYLDATGAFFGDDYCYAEAPTNWMPLPAAPKA